LFLEKTMNTPRFGFKNANTPPKAPPDGRRDEGDRQPAVRAAPPGTGDAGTQDAEADQRGEEPPDEPGYGHGV
jgi:hypothetical protein